MADFIGRPPTAASGYGPHSIPAVVIHRPDLTDPVLSLLVDSNLEGTRVVSIHAPSGMGKTQLLNQIVSRVRQLPDSADRFPVVALDFATLSGNIHEAAPSFYRQYQRATGRRLPRFELLWNELQHSRGVVSAIDPRRKPVAEIEPDGMELAGSIVDAVSSLPLIGVATGAAKVALRLSHGAVDHRRLAEPRAWLRAELAKARVWPTATTPGVDSEQLEQLVAPAIAADLAAIEHDPDRGSEYSGAGRLVLVVDVYEAVSAGFGISPDRTTFPYMVADSLREHEVSALIVLCGQVPARWDAEGEAGSAWRGRFTEHEVPLLDRADSVGYLADRGLSDEALAAEVERLTRGCPALLAAVADVIQDEDTTAAWQSVNDVREQLTAKDPADPDWQAVFMDWYVKRLYGMLQARDAHEFRVAVAGAALRTFDAALVNVLIPDQSGVLQAFEALSRYSFFNEMTLLDAPGPVRRSQRRYRLHDLVRTAVTTSDIYRDDITRYHRRAAAHYGDMTDGVDITRLRDDDQRHALAERLYHLTGLDPEDGLARAEAVFHMLIPAHDVMACDLVVEALGDAVLVGRVHQARLCLLDSQRNRARSHYGRAIDLLIQARATRAPDHSPTRLDIDITRNLAECYRLAGRFRESYEAWDGLWETAQGTADTGARFLAAEGRLRSRIDHDDLRDAAVFGRQARRLLSDLRDTPSALFPELAGQTIRLREAHLERQLSRIARFSGDYIRAQIHAETACRGYESLGDSYHRAHGLIALGHALRGVGEYERGLECAAEARRVFEAFEGGLTEGRVDPDPLGASKALQLRLLTLLAMLQQPAYDDAEQDPPSGAAPAPPAGRVRRSTDGDREEGFDAIADQLLRINDEVSVDYFGPLFAHLALGQRARWAAAGGDQAAVQECHSHMQSTIALCEKIDGRVERAFANLSLADLERCGGTPAARRKARSLALSALIDGEISDSPWIIFHAAVQLALVDELKDRWTSLASATAARLRHPRQISPFEAVLGDLASRGRFRQGAPIPMVTP